MADKQVGWAGDVSAAESKLKQKGMSNKSAVFPDSSCKCSGGSVDSETPRSETARSPGTLGPRVA